MCSTEQYFKALMQRQEGAPLALTAGAGAAGGAGGGREQKAFEPVAFFRCSSTKSMGTTMARLPRPALARYITIKFLSASPSNQVRVSSISAFGLHGQHPLGPSPPSEFKDRVLELVHSLKVLAGAPEASSVWSLDRDLQLVEMAQDLARRLNTEPSAMDCLLLAPSTDELMRFKRLQGVSAQAMQARFAIIKVGAG